MSLASIIGLTLSDPVPGEYLQINFAQGEVSSGGLVYPVILVGNWLDDGYSAADANTIYGPDTTVPMTSEAEAIQLFGAGSELHRMVKRFLTINKSTPLYAIAVDENGSAGQATATITFTGTAVQPGTARIYIGDEYIDGGFAVGDTAAEIAQLMATAVNSRTDWAVTAVANGDDVDLTAKQGGLRGNFIRYFAQVRPVGTGVTVTPGTPSRLTGGTAADDNTNAINEITGSDMYYVVSAAGLEDSSQLTDLLSMCDADSLALTGKYKRVIAGAVSSTLSPVNTAAIALNGALCDLFWQKDSDLTPAEIAADMAAILSLEEGQANPRLNFNFYGADANTSGRWKIKAPANGAKPSRSEVFSALNNGVSPIAVGSKGNSYLTKAITTRSMTGGFPDYRIRDHHKVTICHFYANDLKIKAALQLRGKEIGNDPVGQAAEPGPRVVTPRVLKAVIDGLSRQYSNRDLLEDIETIVANTKAERDSQNLNRLNALIPLDPVNILDQVCIEINQIG